MLFVQVQSHLWFFIFSEPSGKFSDWDDTTFCNVSQSPLPSLFTTCSSLCICKSHLSWRSITSPLTIWIHHAHYCRIHFPETSFWYVYFLLKNLSAFVFIVTNSQSFQSCISLLQANWFFSPFCFCSYFFPVISSALSEILSFKTQIKSHFFGPPLGSYSEARMCGLKSQLCYLLTEWYWINHLTFMSFYFLICKWGYYYLVTGCCKN